MRKDCDPNNRKLSQATVTARAKILRLVRLVEANKKATNQEKMAPSERKPQPQLLTIKKAKPIFTQSFKADFLGLPKTKSVESGSICSSYRSQDSIVVEEFK